MHHIDSWEHFYPIAREMEDDRLIREVTEVLGISFTAFTFGRAGLERFEELRNHFHARELRQTYLALVTTKMYLGQRYTNDEIQDWLRSPSDLFSGDSVCEFIRYIVCLEVDEAMSEAMALLIKCAEATLEPVSA